MDKKNLPHILANVGKRTLITGICVFVFLVIFTVHLILSALSPKENQTGEPPQTNDGTVMPSESFSEFFNGFIKSELSSDMLSLHFTISNPKAYNIYGVTPSLGTVCFTDCKERSAKACEYFEQLTSYDRQSLSSSEQLDYDMLYTALSNSIAGGDFPGFEEPLRPTTGTHVQLPIILSEYAFNSEEDITNYLSLLSSVYTYFESICTYECEKSNAKMFMTDECADKVISQCTSFITNPDDNILLSSFTERLSDMKMDSSRKTELMLENQHIFYSLVIPAYELVIDTLNALKGTSVNPYGLCHFEKGDDYYSYIVRRDTGTSYTISEIKTLLTDALAGYGKSLSALSGASPDMLRSLTKASKPDATPEVLIEFLKEAAAECFPSVPDVSCTVRYVPKSLADYMSPAMYLISPIDAYKNNTIFISEKDNMSFIELFPTLAHETFPGHLYQHTYYLSIADNPMRSLLAPEGYLEGWAVYAEMFSLSYTDFPPDIINSLKYSELISLCLYALADIGIHYDGMTPKELSEFLSDFGIPESTSLSIYSDLAAEPGIYLPYIIGYIEIDSLLSEYKELHPNDFSIKAFHEFILNDGPLCFDLLHAKLKAAA